MKWKNILKQDLKEKTIQALMPFSGTKEQALSFMGEANTENPNPSIPTPYTEEDVKSLIHMLTNAVDATGRPKEREYRQTLKNLRELTN
tara:strand:- start:10944 stop:11210 length:267 start_codon:yes stop_codon:yes gene_type:complete